MAVVLTTVLAMVGWVAPVGAAVAEEIPLEPGAGPGRYFWYGRMEGHVEVSEDGAVAVYPCTRAVEEVLFREICTTTVADGSTTRSSPLGVDPGVPVTGGLPLPRVWDISADGRFVLLSGPSEHLVRWDRTTDNVLDVVDPEVAVGHAELSLDGMRAVLSTDEGLVAGDTDGATDVYWWEAGAGLALAELGVPGTLSGASEDLTYLVTAFGIRDKWVVADGDTSEHWLCDDLAVAEDGSTACRRLVSMQVVPRTTVRTELLTWHRPGAPVKVVQRTKVSCWNNPGFDYCAAGSVDGQPIPGYQARYLQISPDGSWIAWGQTLLHQGWDSLGEPLAVGEQRFLRWGWPTPTRQPVPYGTWSGDMDAAGRVRAVQRADGSAVLLIVDPDDRGTFSDVPPEHPFAEEIASVNEAGILAGFPDGTFRPASLVSRQALAAFLYRLAGAPDGPDPQCATDPYVDVDVDHPFCGEIQWAALAGALGGYADDTFRPSAVVTRQSAMAGLHGLLAPWSPPGSCVSPFPDVPADHPFCDAIAWAAEKGIAQGYPDGGFHPGDPVTRQAMAAFLDRAQALDVP